MAGSFEVDGRDSDDDLSPCAFVDFGGTPNTFSIAVSRSHVNWGNTFRSRCGCCVAGTWYRPLGNGLSLGTAKASNGVKEKAMRSIDRKDSVSNKCRIVTVTCVETVVNVNVNRYQAGKLSQLTGNVGRRLSDVQAAYITACSRQG